MTLQFQPYPVLQQTEAQKNALDQSKWNNLNETLQRLPQLMMETKRAKREQEQYDILKKTLADFSSNTTLSDPESGYQQQTMPGSSPIPSTNLPSPMSGLPASPIPASGQGNFDQGQLPIPPSGPQGLTNQQAGPSGFNTFVPKPMAAQSPSPSVAQSMQTDWSQFHPDNRPFPVLKSPQIPQSQGRQVDFGKVPLFAAPYVSKAMDLQYTGPREEADLGYKQAQTNFLNQRAEDASVGGGLSSLDSILANKVRNGEMSLQDAFALKGKYSSSGIKAPAGFRYTENGDLEAIPGGPAEQKINTQKSKDQATVDSQKQDAQLVIGKIDEALGLAGTMSTGLLGSVMKKVPGSKATDLGSVLDTIHSQLGLGKLMEMKNNSKAGASGMGQLSDREMTLLISALTSLKQSQSKPQLVKHLGEVKTHYQNILKMEEGINPYDQSTQFNQNASTGPIASLSASPKVLYKRNVKTGQRIQSSDGGQTWQPAQ